MTVETVPFFRCSFMMAGLYLTSTLSIQEIKSSAMLLNWIELSGRPREARELLKWCYGRYTISVIMATDTSFTILCVYILSQMNYNIPSLCHSLQPQTACAMSIGRLSSPDQLVSGPTLFRHIIACDSVTHFRIR